MQSALLLGFLKHGPECEGHEIAFGGSIFDIQMLIKLFGLRPNEETAHKIEAVIRNRGPRCPEDRVLTFVSDYGSYCTLRPLDDAASMISTAMQMQEPPL